MVEIKINTVNEAFDEPGPEVARILRRMAEVAEQGLTDGQEHRAMDKNGNTVGKFKYANK